MRPFAIMMIMTMAHCEIQAASSTSPTILVVLADDVDATLTPLHSVMPILDKMITQVRHSPFTKRVIHKLQFSSLFPFV